MSSSTNSSSITQKTVDFRIKYKTEVFQLLSRDVAIGTNADFAHLTKWYFHLLSQCAFAHSEHELRDKH